MTMARSCQHQKIVEYWICHPLKKWQLSGLSWSAGPPRLTRPVRSAWLAMPPTPGLDIPAWPLWFVRPARIARYPSHARPVLLATPAQLARSPWLARPALLTRPASWVYHSRHHATDGGIQERDQRCNLLKKETYPHNFMLFMIFLKKS